MFILQQQQKKPQCNPINGYKKVLFTQILPLPYKGIDAVFDRLLAEGTVKIKQQIVVTTM